MVDRLDDVREVRIANPVGERGFGTVFDRFWLILVVEDWDLYEEFLGYVVKGKMRKAPDGMSMLFIEPPIHNAQYRSKLVELFFEKMQGGCISFAKSSLMTR